MSRTFEFGGTTDDERVIVRLKNDLIVDQNATLANLRLNNLYGNDNTLIVDKDATLLPLPPSLDGKIVFKLVD